MGPTKYEIQRQLELLPRKKKADDLRLVNNLRKFTELQKQPHITLNSDYPTFTIYNLEQADQIKEEIFEFDELDEEISALIDDIEDR